MAPPTDPPTGGGGGPEAQTKPRKHRKPRTREAG